MLQCRMQRRFLCSKATISQANQQQRGNHQPPKKWNIKQVTKSNFGEALQELKTHLRDSHFVAVSLQNTGSYSARWHRILPFDTHQIAYQKAKYAAERFQVLQFAVCPFSFRASKLIAYPYNFHLFPRDELKIGMPSYNFLCQSSYLTSMAKDGFNFNLCVYDGISYLSRSQESAAKDRVGTPVSRSHVVKSSTALSVADSVFVERIKSRVKHWISACKESKTKTDEALIRSLRKLILGSEEYDSRPCLSIDVCSDRQVQLTLELLRDFFEDLVPLLVPAKGGGTQAVRVVLTASREDRDLFEKELQSKEEEQSKRVRGFREVIDLISAAQKPVVAHNSLNDFVFIYSKFLAPLPPRMDDFEHSIRSVFPCILDVDHLMKEIRAPRRVTSTSAAISYTKKRFFVPIDTEIPQQDSTVKGDGFQKQGHNALRISQLFAKLCSVLGMAPETLEAGNGSLSSALEVYANIFSPCAGSSEEIADEDVGVWTDNQREVKSANLVFLWGFGHGISAGMLKGLLCGAFEIFSDDLDIRLVDKSCAVLVFWRPGLSERFLRAMDSGGVNSESVRELISDGLRAANYETYKRVIQSGLWGADLADSLDKELANHNCSEDSPEKEQSVISWDNDSMINLDDL